MRQDKRKGEVGIYLEEIGRYPLLTLEEEKILAEKIRAGDERAKEKFIKANLRLVVSVAKRYLWVTKSGSYNVSFMDLISAGNEGLMIAVDKFDPDKGKFSTYAWYWIRQKIAHFLMDKGRVIRIPQNRQEMMYKIMENQSSYYIEHGELPSKEWLAEKLGIKPGLIAKLEREFQEISSLDAQFSQDEDAENLEYFLKDRKAEKEMEDTLLTALPEKVVAKELSPALERFFSGLDERERTILALRTFRSKEEGRLTLKQLGKVIGKSRERIRQIEKKLISRLQAHIALLVGYPQFEEFLAQGRTLAWALERFQEQPRLAREVTRVRKHLPTESIRVEAPRAEKTTTPLLTIPVPKKDLGEELKHFLDDFSRNDRKTSDFLPKEQTIAEALNRLAAALGVK